MNLECKRLMSEMEKHSDPVYASWCKQYMRGQFEFIGVPVPLQRQLTKAWVKTIDKPSRSQLRERVQYFWGLPEREYQRVALDLLDTWRKQLTFDDIAWIEQLITTKSWWDTVDTIAPNVIGFLYVSQPPEVTNEISNVLEKWNRSDNIWLQRTSILFQLSAKSRTNEQLLYRYIENLAASNEFFVQKAIGWALRQYARVQPQSVLQFVHSCELKPLSKREALKHLV